MNEPKETISARINPDLLRRIEQLAEAQERTRSEMIERCLSRGIEAEEDRVKFAEGPISGRVLELLASKPVIKLLELIDGGSIDPSQVQKTRQMILKARNSQKSKRGVAKS